MGQNGWSSDYCPHTGTTIQVCNDCERETVAATKRDLVKQALTVIWAERALWDDCVEINSQQHDLTLKAIDDVLGKLAQVFTDPGVAVETREDA